jgi:tagaturonate reductase
MTKMQLGRELLDNNPELKEKVECGTLKKRPEKIIQFGEGNFLRAFTDWMVDRLNRADKFDGSIVVVQPIKIGIAHLLNEQDGLYTLLLRGYEQGELKTSREVISSISRGLSPYENYDEFLACARNPEMRYMFSNTTEAGITFVEEPQPVDRTPDSFPAKVTAFLFERFKEFKGAPDKGMVIFCCELIDRNGDNLKRMVLKHAANWKLIGDFAEWVKNSCHFLNTLVDRIVPGYPRENAHEIENELGYRDKLLDTGEIFHLWVIEGPEELAAELPFHELGLNVIWTDDMTPYRTRKVRMLNGAHTSSVLAAYLGGLDTVGEMLDDDDFNKFLGKALLEEILPNVAGDLEQNRVFAEGILERFRNPYIRHELLSISLNSVSKWKVRVLPSLLDYYKQTGSLPQVLTFSLAALIAFYNGVGCAEPELRGERGNSSYSIKDNIDVLDVFEKRWMSFNSNHDIRVLAGTLLANESLWGQDLTLLPGMIDMVTAHLQNIMINGARAAVKSLIA